jgi:hypothetical protein
VLSVIAVLTYLHSLSYERYLGALEFAFEGERVIVALEEISGDPCWPDTPGERARKRGHVKGDATLYSHFFSVAREGDAAILALY